MTEALSVCFSWFIDTVQDRLGGTSSVEEIVTDVLSEYPGRTALSLDVSLNGGEIDNRICQQLEVLEISAVVEASCAEAMLRKDIPAMPHLIRSTPSQSIH